MIEFLNTWAKNLGLAIVVISILEMLLPNNNIKKYIRMVMGVYILFCIVSPWFDNSTTWKDNANDIMDSITNQTQVTSTQVNQTSMDNRIQELYVEELEKDITKKLEEKGYELSKCKVKVNIANEEEDTRIEKIKIEILNKQEVETNKEEEKIENKIVTEIQKIKTIDTKVEKKDKQEEKQQESKVTKADIQNVKKFLIEEYGVKEKCLEVN